MSRQVHGVAAVVRAGCLTAVRSGRCDVTDSVRLEGPRWCAGNGRTTPRCCLPLPRPVALVDTTVVPQQGPWGPTRTDVRPTP